jgi:putative ABC transport system permease protein
MAHLRSFISRMLNIFRRSRVESDLAEQLDAHREMIKADLLSRGIEPSQADIASRRALGNEQLVREFSRDQLFPSWIDGIVRDSRYAVRSLCRVPVFTIAVILTLALGIGLNTAIFSAVDRVLLRPLSFPDAERIMLLHETGVGGRNSPKMDVNPSNWLDWQRDSKTFESFAAWTDRNPATLTGQGEPERLEAETVSYEFFSVLKVQPLMGRDFRPEDDRPGAGPTAVLSYSLWQRKFAGDPKIVGKTVQLNSRPVEIIGVMPQGFHFLSQSTQIWRAFGLDRNLAWRERGGRFLPYVVGRVRPNVEPAAAKVEMQTIASHLAQSYAFNENTSVAVIPIHEAVTGQVRTSLLVLFAAVGVLLIIACSNIANLLVARSANRRREIAIRTSLGAGRGAIVRQVLIESLLLAAAGGIGGVFIARWSLNVLLRLAPANLLPMAGVSIDGSMLLYTFALSVATGILVGLVPAVPSVRLAVWDQLRNGGRSITASLRLRQALIIAQVAMTIILLGGAGLLVRSLLRLTRDPIGVDPKNVLTMRVELPPARYNESRQIQFFQQVTEKLHDLPGVESVSAAADIPVSHKRTAGTGFQILGEPPAPLTAGPFARIRVVMPGYFKTLGIPLLQGRDFNQEDMNDSAPQVFVVNEAFVKAYLSSRDALSTSISVFMKLPNPAAPMYGEPNNPFGRIIGVAGDVKEGTLRDSSEPTVFYDERQLTSSGMTLLVRSARGSELAREAGVIVHEIDRNLPLIEVRMLSDAFSETLARDRLNAIVSAAFAACALLLASVGLYGLLAFTVAERTTEIGIRMALGAQASQVLRAIVRQGYCLVLIGGFLGLIAAFAASRFLKSLLFGVTPYDPFTFAFVSALLAFVTLIAVLIPAWRATQVNPIMALRED